MLPKPISLLCLLSTGLLLALPALAQNGTYTDPAQVTDPDFLVQGEYAGKIGENNWGIQVIALGEGQFQYTAYFGGLPGAGWSGNKEWRIKGTGKRENQNSVRLSPGEGSQHYAIIQDGAMKLYHRDSGTYDTTLPRLERQSPTLGMKPPSDATILFDGLCTTAWKDGKLDGDLLRNGTSTIELFQGFSLHMEFRLPYKPKGRGQDRGNSGFYAQGRYEVQLLDSFGLEGEQNECGGIYSVKAPDQNLCYPPLTWQTYDVDFTPAQFDANGKKTANARFTVKHNGTLIHNNVQADHATTASPLKEGPEPGPIYLQDHGNPVQFRNIWLVKKP